MGEAEILLNNLTENPYEHQHVVPDSDTYFRIDPNTRQIKNTNYNKTVIMQGDHNSERFTFEIPRYVDGHDMSLCNRVIVHFDNVGDSIENVHHDVAYMDDLRINPENPETVISSWLIRREATQIVGILSFAIQYLCVGDVDDVITYEWKTDSYDEIEIRQSKNNGEAAVIDYTNVLEQWRAHLFSAGDSVMTDITAAGVNQVAAIQNESATQRAAIARKGAETLATIPDDYTEVYNMATEAIRTKADGIVCEVKGSAITINNASDDYIRGLSVYGKSTQVTTTGKNLLNNELHSMTINGLTIDVHPDKTFTVNGTANDGVFLTLHTDFNPGPGEYILSGCPSGGGSDKYIIYMTDTESGFYAQDMGRGYKFNHPGNILPDVRVAVYKGTTLNNVTFMPMIRNASISDDTYEPYTGGYASPSPDYPQEIVSVENPTINVYGKNLLETSGATETINGVTFTANKDGSILVSGTATANAYYVVKRNVPLTSGEKYKLTGCPNNGSNATYLIYHHNNVTGTDYYDTGDGVTFTATSDSSNIVIAVYKGVTVNSEVFYPMVRHASISDAEFEPHKPAQTVTLANTLHGIPVSSGGNYTDENGQQWICDEVDLERGVYIQRVHSKTFSGYEGWDLNTIGKDQGVNVYQLYYSGIDMVRFHGYCSHFVSAGSWATGIGSLENVFWVASSNVLCFKTDGVQTLADFKAYIADQAAAGTPVTVYYAVNAPIETPLTAEEITAYRALKTNYPNTTILNDSGAWMTVKYNVDTLIFLRDNQPKPTDEQIQAAVEAYVEENDIQLPGEVFSVDRWGNVAFPSEVTTEGGIFADTVHAYRAGYDGVRLTSEYIDDCAVLRLEGSLGDEKCDIDNVNTVHADAVNAGHVSAGHIDVHDVNSVGVCIESSYVDGQPTISFLGSSDDRPCDLTDVNAIVLTSPDGSKFKLSVTNDGNLIMTEVR